MSASRRFYTAVTVTEDCAIALDGRIVKTPLKSKLVLPTRALADEVAAEWAAQGEKIDPATMVLTKLANTALDRVAPERPRIVGEILDYAGSDLVCYRADRPPALVTRQRAAWDPIVDWARVALDAPFVVTTGIVHVSQPNAALRAFEAALAVHNDFELSTFYSVMTMTGSALIPLMLARAALSPETAWTAAHVDEDYQIENWGEDEEAALRRVRRHGEFMTCCRFMALAKTNG